MAAKTESVAPAVMKSERTRTESDYVHERNKAAEENAKGIGVASVHGNKDAVDRLYYALNNDSTENVMVFYVNKKKTTAVLRKAGYTITGVPNISDGFNHSIYDSGAPVKLRISSQTETRQFKNWFKGSRIVNEDGTPKVMYHGSPAKFIIFR